MDKNEEKDSCCHCGETGIKLWREFAVTNENTPLWCAKCLAKHLKKDINNLNPNGELNGSYFFDHFIPAIWGKRIKKYLSFLELPKAKEKLNFWKSLPNFPESSN